MLYWTLAFLFIALVAALFGFSSIAAGAAGFAQVIFFLFLLLFAVSLIYTLVTGRQPPVPPAV
ncbi:MAG: DUF1328 domain-containing protein [Tepidisphaeraceae bacterium]